MSEEQSPRERILAAAASVFAAEGYAGTKVDRIARLAGVNKAALYYHVGDKDALYEAVLIENVRQVAGLLEDALQGIDDPERMMENLVRALAAAFGKSALVPRIMAQELARGGSRLSPPVMHEFLKVFACTRRVIEKGRQKGVFMDINPILAHLHIVGTLAFAALSQSARTKARAAVSNEVAAAGVDWDFTAEDVIRLTLKSFGVAPMRGKS